MSNGGPARRGGTPVRVVVQNGEYWLCNKGDLAMLDVTVRRIRERWVDARIGVATSALTLLRAYAPEAEPINMTGRGTWSRSLSLRRVGAVAGPTIVGPPTMAWLHARDAPRRRARQVAAMVARRAPAVNAGENRRKSRGLVAVGQASLVLAMGGGYFADVDAEQVHRTLDLLERAANCGIPTAMVGQGLGPLDDPELLRRAAAVLPRVDLIALREGRQGPRLLESLGVPSDRVLVTGDDAIELAYDLRQEWMGDDVGFCLRVAQYSPVAQRTGESVRQVLHTFVREANCALVPFAISEYRSEDRRSTLPLVAGCPTAAAPLGPYATPREMASRVSRCRVLVTGAYHLAVFALSQGIPVVGLSSSRYYDDKLFGLGDMFGGGLQVVRLDEADLGTRLESAIRTAWADAPQLRADLRARAAAQIQLSRRGFDRVFDLVAATRRAKVG